MSAFPHLAEQQAVNEAMRGGGATASLPSREEVCRLRDSVAEMNGNLAAQVRHMALAVDNALINERLREAARISTRERRAVFISGPGFAGNIKYAWLDFAQRAKAWDIECWFAPQTKEQDQLAKALGVPHFPLDWKQWTREHTSLALRTAVRVIDSHYVSVAFPNPYLHALLSGAHEVQLWHGISIKEIALRSAKPLAEMTVEHAQNLASCRMDVFCGSSAGAEAEWRRWFNFDRYANLGYPRNDVMLREPTELDLLGVDTAALGAARQVRARGGKVFFYTPTYRDARDGAWLAPEMLNAFAEGLARQGHLLLMNFHPLEQGHQPRYEARCPGVGFVAAGTDIYPLLRETDALVTDYSSLMFDYLMTDRPIVWFRPDHEDYVARSRALYDAKIEMPLGPLATTVDDVVRECLAVDQQNPAFAEIRADLRAKLFDVGDDRASERTSALIRAEVDRVVG